MLLKWTATLSITILASLALGTADLAAQKISDGKAYEVGYVGFLRGGGCTSCGQVISCDCKAGCTDGAGAGGAGGDGSGGSGSGDDSFSLLGSRYGSAAASTAAMPNMIGDFFGGGSRYAFVGGPNGATVNLAGGDRRFKFAENNNPFPQDRLFFNYNHFHNAVIDVNGVDEDVNRFVFGVEKTFFDGLWSVEFRVPFAGGLDATGQQGSNSTTGTEFGNMVVALKRLMWQNECAAISMGLGAVLPTGPDAFAADISNIRNVTISNESVHLLPFLGIYYAPTDRVFTNFFAQLDFDVNGNGFVDATAAGVPNSIGVLQDQSLLFLDYSIGYWMYRDSCACWITGIAPMLELHYSTSLQESDFDQGGVFIDNDFRTDVLNLTAGLYLRTARNASIQMGGVVPLREIGTDKQFDAEFGLQYTWRY